MKIILLFSFLFTLLATAASAAEPGYFTVKVKRGDTLQRISSWAYGTTRKWHEIYSNNKAVIPNKDVIEVGMELQLKVRDGMTEEAKAQAAAKNEIAPKVVRAEKTERAEKKEIWKKPAASRTIATAKSEVEKFETMEPGLSPEPMYSPPAPAKKDSPKKPKENSVTPFSEMEIP